MWKYLILAILLIQGAKAQPAKQKIASQPKAVNAQVSPAPVTQRQIETNDKANNQQPKQDDESKAFQQTQIRQCWVLVVTSIATVLLLIAYTVFAGLQWWQIREQANQARAQVTKMQATFNAILDQSKTLRRQAIGTTSQARSTRDALTETRNLVKQNEEIVKAMQGQLDAINKQETHLSDQAGSAKQQAGVMQKQLSVIERQTTLIEKSTANAEQSSIYANRAYVVAKIRNDEPYQFKLAIENGGNMPANNVRVAYTCRVMNRLSTI